MGLLVVDYCWTKQQVPMLWALMAQDWLLYPQWLLLRMPWLRMLWPLGPLALKSAVVLWNLGALHQPPVQGGGTLVTKVVILGAGT